jgi:ABC-2 type transport system ATP-binding protein
VAATIETIGLTKRYGDSTVVDGLDLKAESGEVFGLLGPNGAGKTTTILMLLGLTEPTSGSATVLGLDPRRDPIAVKERVGYVPDAVGFYEGMTGRQNLRFTGRLNLGDEVEIEERVERALLEVGLAEAADRRVDTYSRGMKQRLGIADALIKFPKVLILDEPTTAIDPEGVVEILGLIRRLADERGVTVLLSSHLLHQVQGVCDRVAVFVNGRVVAVGSPDELADQGSPVEAVEIAADADPRPALESVGFVRSVESGRSRSSYTISIDRGSTPLLVKRLADEGLAVTGVHRTALDLEHIYRQYFERGEDNG